ncbi:hypothetical protein DFH08DRAFT_974785 [Mycena albidolilacea]|uniref:Secreted protein n=1 Tax=Mycena albidolilacea TaxID=1033008 RepID=A0AAD6Z6J2_9AGAR|nr:hypothetical protein DFH08DRAFT_974785 [Mycena albidolilacea]
MLFFAAALSLVLATPAIAFPSNLTARDDLTCVHCGTTSDATLSDCQALVQPDTWAAAWAGDSNTCHWSSATPGWYNNKAYNVACHGNCCAYYSPYPGRSATLDQEITRQRAASLLGCGATDVNKINGLEIAEADRSGVCLSNGDGCGDCFDDNDFEASCA